MDFFSDDELNAGLAALTRRRRLQVKRTRCLKFAKAACGAGTAGLIFLCASGFRPASLAVPLLLAVFSLLLGAASAALFARAARAALDDADPDADDDDRGPGGGWEHPRGPTGGGSLEFDWEQFEQAFARYSERARMTQVS